MVSSGGCNCCPRSGNKPSPPWGEITLSPPWALNTSDRDWASSRYFSSCTLDRPYITTKKANSRVTKSAQEIIQRSVRRSVSGRRRLGIRPLQITLQAQLYALGALPFGDKQQAFQHHFLIQASTVNYLTRLGRQRQQQQVGESDAVNGGHKGGRNPRTQHGRVFKIGHHLNQTQYRTDNAQSRRIAPHAFDNTGCLIVTLLLRHQFHLQGSSDQLDRFAVSQQLQSIAHQRVVNLSQLLLQRQQPLAPGRNTPVNQLIDSLRMPGRRLTQRQLQQLQGTQKEASGCLHQCGAQGSAQDNQGRRQVEQCL